MNGVIDRTVIAQAVIVLAASIGAWLVFVEPRAVEAQQLQEDIRAKSEHAAEIDQETMQRLAGRLNEVRSRIRRIDQRGDLTRDSSHLYSVIMDLARTHDVTVASLNPGSPSTTRSSGRTARSSAGADNEDAGDLHTIDREVTVSVSGRYHDIASFVDAMQTIRGYVELKNLSIAAASGSDEIVNARLTCRTVRFALPERLQRMIDEFGGGADASKPEGEEDDA